MMVVASQVLCAQLAELTSWESLYWWNWDKKPEDPEFGWHLGNRKLEPVAIHPSIPAYNFDLLFEKLRPVFLVQEDKDKLEAFKIMLTVPNPADALCRLAIKIVGAGLLK